MNQWSEDDMFQTNEELIGRKIEYDQHGNPQLFATKGGFDGIDPHAYHIVGGHTILNASGFFTPCWKRLVVRTTKEIFFCVLCDKSLSHTCQACLLGMHADVFCAKINEFHAEFHSNTCI